MKPQIAERKLESSGVEEQSSFGISNADQAHIMRILRDQLYSDRILAVLREYSTNAWDANRMAGRGDVPIEVHLPNIWQPYLLIRDSGPGLSKNDVFTVYTQYGASTKRNSNDAVGMLGIGSKSAFSYTSNFMITSWHAGKKMVFNATLDEKDIGIVQLFHEEDCSPNESGVEIKVPVKKADFDLFSNRAKFIFPFFDPIPKLNQDLGISNQIGIKYKNGFVNSESSSYQTQVYGVIGCIPYRIDHREVSDLITQSLLHGIKGCWGIFLEMGSADFSASREELKYTDRTKKAIQNAIVALNEEISKDIKDIWNTPNESYFERRQRLLTTNSGFSYKSICNFLGICSELVFDRSDVKNSKQKFYRYCDSRQIHVDSIVILDAGSKKNLSGYQVDPHRTTFIFPKTSKKILDENGKVIQESVTLDDVILALNEYLENKKFTGIPILKASELVWINPARKSYTKNKKHAQKNFIWANNQNACCDSDYWEQSEWEPSHDDVYITIYRFKPYGTSFEANGFLAKMLYDDEKLCGILGESMPRLLAYKITKKTKHSLVKMGKHYVTWRKELRERASKDERVYKLANLEVWHSAYMQGLYEIGVSSREVLLAIERFTAAGISNDNIIISYLEKLIESRKTNKKVKVDISNELPLLSFTKEFEEISMRREIIKRYPLAGLGVDIQAMANNNHIKRYRNVMKNFLIPNGERDNKLWAEYILLQDNKNIKKN